MTFVSLKSLGKMSKAVLAAIAILALVSAPAYANNAQDLFADGNRLFRDDLYWAALLRYRQAADEGLDSPLLHFNTGVAHYRAKQHVRARESLLEASRSPSLRFISQYNLGLNAYAMKDYDEALKWFRRARDQDRSKEIRKLAIRAIAMIENREVEEEPVIVRAEATKRKRDVSDLYLRARVGAGIDSNVFRSPSEAYVDLADPTLPLITPEVQEGIYIPVSLEAKYSINSFEHESFFAMYRMAGRFYQDEALTNGNEHIQELAVGSEYRKRTENRDRQIYSAFTVAQHNEVYYNRDDGAARSFQGTDIEDRFNYLRYGPEIWWRQRYSKFSFGLFGKAQLWNYEDTEAVPEYDHKYTRVGLSLQYRLTNTTLVRFTADSYKRHFGDRPSFELDGTQPANNPPVRYDYLEGAFTARQRVTNAFWFGMTYMYRDREDRHVGYNNYQMDHFGAELHLDLGNRFDLDVAAFYRIYEFENAFAFNNPVAGPKTLERGYGTAAMSYRMTQNLALVAEYMTEQTDSNDTRIAFDRNTLMLLVRWDM